MPQVEEGKADDQANRQFISAKASIQQGKFSEAAQSLKGYLAGFHATKANEAIQLLDDIALAASENRAIDLLCRLTDDDFKEFEETGTLQRLKIIEIEPLRVVVAERLRNSLPIARSQRQSIKERQIAAELVAKEQRLFAQKEESDAKQQRILSGMEDGEVVIRYGDGSIKETGQYRQGQKKGLWLEHIDIFQNQELAQHKLGEADKEDDLSVGMYQDGFRQGLWVASRQGKVTGTADYVRGSIDGFEISYKANGQPRIVNDYKQGKLEGYTWLLPRPGNTPEEQYGSWMRNAYGQPIEFGQGAPPAYQKARLEDAVRTHAEGMAALLKK